MTARTDLARGLRIEDPDVLVNWGSSITQLLEAFRAAQANEPREVASLYYKARGKVLGGLHCQIGFHFEATPISSSLNKIEIFDNGERDIEASYRAFQERLVQLFGQPTMRKVGGLSPSMPDCEWRIGMVRIVHYVMDRFGPEEHLWIQRQSRLAIGPNGILAIIAALAILTLLSFLGVL